MTSQARFSLKNILPFGLGSSPSKKQQESDAWEAHVQMLRERGIPEPGDCVEGADPTEADHRKTYNVYPSFVKMLPWAEFLPESQTMLLEDALSVAAFFELSAVGTEGREASWLKSVRDALENALQDSFDEHDDHNWVCQFYARDDTNWDPFMARLRDYVHPRARGTVFTEEYLRNFAQHLKGISRPGGLFEDTTVSRLPWRGQTRQVRMVVYRRANGTTARRGQNVEEELNTICDRLVGGLANASIRAVRMTEAGIHDWLLRWFNPNPKVIKDKDEFYRLTAYPETEDGEIELATARDFSDRLFFNQPVSDVQNGIWYFDDMPHRVVMLDKLRNAPRVGHLTGETKKGGDAINAVFDQMPEDTTLCLTMVVTPQDILEAKLNYLGKKSVGDTLASSQAREDIQVARNILGSSHKLYQCSVAFYIRGNDLQQLDDRTLQLHNVMLNNGLMPVREHDEVAPLNSYLRWLPACFDPSMKNATWYTRLMFAQHVANLCPVWGRSVGTGHPGHTFFNRGGGPITFDPLNPLDRQMNAHLFLFGPTGAGKSATLNFLLHQAIALYRPRLFIVEAGNSFGLTGDYAVRMGLTVNRVKLAPGSGVSLAPFADATRLLSPEQQGKWTTAEDELEDSIAPPNLESDGTTDENEDDERDILGELEITARLMITGGEPKEEHRMIRADRSAIRQCIIDAAVHCNAEGRTVITEDVRDALRRAGHEKGIPEARRTRLLEMADAMDIFCQGADGQMFNRVGTPWPEADITIVDLATYAREGYGAQLSIAYISLINTVNNIAERDQYLGRPIINVTDEGHIITKNPLLSPYIVKSTKMWRKLGAWFWLATQNVDDLPPEAAPMLNMIEWWICLSMPPDEVSKIAKFRSLNESQKALMLSARKEKHKFAEGVVLSKSMELLFRTVPPSLYLALAMTEPEEKNERYRIMKEKGCDELDAAIYMAEDIDRARGLEVVRTQAVSNGREQ